MEAKDDKEPVEPKAKRTVVGAPDNWKTEAEWDKAPSSIRQRIIKREAEFSAGIKQYADKARAFDEYEQVIGPRRQRMQAIGVTPFQVVAVALNWADQLQNKDQNVQRQALSRQLAANYNLDLEALVGGGTSGSDNFRVGGDDDLPPVLQQRLDKLEQENNRLNQQLYGITNTFESQQQQSLQAALDNWSKDKPHYQTVQMLMGRLVQSGAVPIVDGAVDLDMAYDMAVNATPHVKQLIELENAEKARIATEAKAKKDKAAKAAALSKARGASASLRPSSPSTGLNGGASKGLSVRDTIRMSLKEVTSNQ